MKIPTVGWAFFGLTVVILTGYLLNRGIYVGSSIRMKYNEVRYKDGSAQLPYFNKYCQYLYLNGVREEWTTGSFERDEAEDGFCAPLRAARS